MATGLPNMPQAPVACAPVGQKASAAGDKPAQEEDSEEELVIECGKSNPKYLAASDVQQDGATSSPEGHAYTASPEGHGYGGSSMGSMTNVYLDAHMVAHNGVPVIAVTGSDGAVTPVVQSMQSQSGVPRQMSSASKVQPSRGFKVSVTVRIGGGVLALCAGMVNAVSFLSLGAFVSHLTGTLSKVGLGIQDEDTADASDSAKLVLSFILGSTWTGFLIGKDTIHFGLALYDLCLLTEAGLLVIATLAHEHDISRYVAAAACGLQNGLATHWGGAVIRTTHVTGLFTDVGLLMGRMVSMLCRKSCGRRFDDFDRVYIADDLSKLSVLLSIATAYLLGIILGASFHEMWDHHALLVPAVIVGTIGLAYSFYRVIILHHTLFSAEEMETVDVPQEILELEKLQDMGKLESRGSRVIVEDAGVPTKASSYASSDRPPRIHSDGRLSPASSDGLARMASGLSDAFHAFNRSGPAVPMTREEALEHLHHLGGMSSRLSGKMTRPP